MSYTRQFYERIKTVFAEKGVPVITHFRIDEISGGHGDTFYIEGRFRRATKDDRPDHAPEVITSKRANSISEIGGSTPTPTLQLSHDSNVTDNVE